MSGFFRITLLRYRFWSKIIGIRDQWANILQGRDKFKIFGDENGTTMSQEPTGDGMRTRWGQICNKSDTVTHFEQNLQFPFCQKLRHIFSSILEESQYNASPQIVWIDYLFSSFSSAFEFFKNHKNLYQLSLDFQNVEKYFSNLTGGENWFEVLRMSHSARKIELDNLSRQTGAKIAN